MGFEQSDTCYDIMWVVFKPDIGNNRGVKAEWGGPSGGQCMTPDVCRMYRGRICLQVGCVRGKASRAEALA